MKLYNKKTFGGKGKDNNNKRYKNSRNCTEENMKVGTKWIWMVLLTKEKRDLNGFRWFHESKLQ